MTTISRWAGGVLLAASLLPWAAAASAGTTATPDSGDPRATAHSGNATTCADAGLTGSLITFTSTNDGTYLDITAVQSGRTVTGVVVKGGDAFNVYLPDKLGALPWLKLHAPLDSSGKPAGLSHFYVCGTEGSTATPCPTTTVTKTVTESAPPVTETVTATHTVTTTAPGATQTVTTTAPGETTTVTAPPVTVTAPPVTVTETHTATVTATHTVTTTAPGETTTVTAPPVTVTTTAPGATQTVTTTAPGETTTVTAPGATQTVTATVTSSSGTSVLPTKIGQSTSPAGGVATSPGTAVLGEKVGSLPQTGPGLPVGKALALSLALMLAGVGLLALPGHVGLEINRKH